MKKLLAAILTAGALAAAALVVGSPAGAQTNTEGTSPVYTVDGGSFEFTEHRLGPPGGSITIRDQIVGGELYADGTGFIELARTGNIDVTSVNVMPHRPGSIAFTYSGVKFSGPLFPNPPHDYYGSFWNAPLTYSKLSHLVLTPVR